MRIRIVVALMGLFALAGCQTAAQVRLQTIRQDNGVAKTAISACETSVSSKPEYASLASRLVKDGHPSLAQLSDETRMAEPERTLYVEFQSDLQPCRKLMLDRASALGPAFSSALSTSFDEGDQNRLELIKRQITWGEFYAKMRDTMAKMRSSLQAADRGLMHELDAEHRQELQNRANAMAAFSASMQQVNDNLQRQQLINAVNRPVTTNCNRFGDQVTCHSF